jgi:two-component system chemotaxis response regulator CheB
MKSSRLKAEVDSAAEKNGASFQLFKEGKLTPVTCPECGGVLAQMEEGGRLRYRCHTGHSFSSDSLLLAVGEQIEHSFYQAVRSVEEGIMLLNQLGDYLAEANNPKLAAAYFNKAREEQERATLLRSILHVPEEVNEGFQPKQNGNGGKNNGSS